MGENRDYKIGEKVYVTCDSGKSGFIGIIIEKKVNNYLIKHEDSDKIYDIDDDCIHTASWLSDW